jgi:hypothetical protein
MLIWATCHGIVENKAGLALRSRFGEVGSVSPKKTRKNQKKREKTQKFTHI